MMEILTSIENSSIGTFVRESPTLFGYTFFLSLHAMGLAFMAGLNTAIALRLLGVGRGIPVPPLDKLFPVMYGGFWVQAFSGTALLTASATSDLVNPMFYIKLGCIALAVVNLIMLRRYGFRDVAATGTVEVPVMAKMLAATSIVLWSGAIVAGRLTEYPQFVRRYFGI